MSTIDAVGSPAPGPSEPADVATDTAAAPDTAATDPADAGAAGTAGTTGTAEVPGEGGRPADPAWARHALLGLLAATAVLYLWGLSASGWANTYYAAAVQAGSSSWKAFFFGSLDGGNAITVDKAPAFLW